MNEEERGVMTSLTFLTTFTLKSRPLRFAIPRKVPGMISWIRFLLRSRYSRELSDSRSTSATD